MEILIADKPTLDSVNKDAEDILELVSMDKSTALYGVRINKNDSNPNTRVEYIFDAIGKTPSKMNYATGVFEYGGWDDVWFINKLKPVVLNYNGSIRYTLQNNDYHKMVEGGTWGYTGTDSGHNVMISIPLVWMYQYEDDSYEYILVCEEQYNENFKAYAHTREDGTVLDTKYLACYKSCYINNEMRSLIGQTFAWGKTIQQNSTICAQTAAGWSMRSWDDRNLINSLLLIMGKSEDSQTVFGNGNESYGDKLTTGTLDDKGLFYGYNDLTHQVKVFGIEGWWGDMNEFVNGAIVKSGGVIYTKHIGPYDPIGTGYDSTGVTFPSGTNDSFAVGSSCGDFGRIPTSVGGSSSTYLCDTFACVETNTASCTVCGMGNTSTPGKIGMNFMNFTVSTSTSGTNYGCSLSYLKYN